MSSDLVTTTADDVLAGIEVLLDELSRAATVGLAARQRLALAVRAVRLRDRLAAVAARLVAEAELADAGMVAAGVPVKSVLVHDLVMSPGAAGRLVNQAVALTGRPATLAAAQAGVVTAEQAAVIVKAVDALPADTGEVTSEQVDAGEATLLGYAAQFHAGSLKVLGGRLLEVIAPDEVDRLQGTRLEREFREAHKGRFLQFRDDGHGVTRLSGSLPTTSAVLIRAQLDAFVAAARRAELEQSSVAGAEPAPVLPVTPAGMGQRRADALVAMAQSCAAERVPPMIAGDRPRVLVLMGYEKLLQTARDHAQDLAREARRAASGQSERAPDQPLGGQSPDHAQGLARAARRAASGQSERAPDQPQGGQPPDQPQGGQPPDHLGPDGVPHRSQPGETSPDLVAAQLLSGERVPAGVLRRWLCDAELLPIVLGGESEVLDVGRERRFATRAQRIALTVRDRGCVFPGCDAPPHLCEAHHIWQWALSGPTDLANLALLCWAHHGLCEPGRPARDQWLIQMIDGVPAAIPPARLDPTRTPRTHERFLKPDIRPG